ncbi:MAG TPA: peptidylprolyl isomerase [Pyrinomonadaceae bacterium]|jgi:peptidyl-prolyl cis-trans isomerase B (cyclophilin B)
MNLGSRLALLLLCLFAFNAAVSAQTTPTATPAPPSTQAAPQKANQRPAVSASAASEPFDGASVERMAEQCVKLETDAGAIELEMLPEAAPESVRNFLNLVATGMLDTTTFSRVVKDFVIQGGNLSTREKVSMEIARRSRHTIPDEPNYVKHQPGIVSMARPDEPNSATTNFFILVADAPFLDGKFSAFGRVTSGMQTVDAINRAPSMPTNAEKPLRPVRIKRATVAPCPAKPAKPGD